MDRVLLMDQGLPMGQGTWFLVHTLDIAPGGTGHGHELPIRAPGYRHRGDVGDPSGTAGWIRRKKGQPLVPGLLKVSGGGTGSCCLQVRMPSLPSLGGRRIQACALQPPGSCWVFRAVLAGPLQGAPGLPGLQGESCEGDLIQVKGHKGVDPSWASSFSQALNRRPSRPPPVDSSCQPQPTLERQRTANYYWPSSPQIGKIQVLLGNKGWVWGQSDWLRVL